MDKEIIKDNKIKLIICIILSLSIFSIYIPINTGGYFTIIMWFVQIIIPIIFGVLIKEKLLYLYSRSDFIKYTKQYFYMDMGTKPNYNGKRIS